MWIEREDGKEMVGIKRGGDVIYRQDAIDAVEHTKSAKAPDGEVYVAKINAEMNIQLLPSAQLEQRWIPVSDRLPEYGKSVLCYFKEDEDFGVNHVIDEEDGEWFINGVTAWMPLPEPYREE